jgi:hypothetical protein
VRGLFRKGDWRIFTVIVLAVVLLICAVQFGWIASGPSGGPTAAP